MPDLDMQWMNVRLDPGAARIGTEEKLVFTVMQPCLSTRGNMISARSKLSVARASRWPRSSASAEPTDCARPSSTRFVLTTASQQQRVQRVEIANTRHRHQVVASEIAAFPFNAAFSCPSPGLQNSAANRQCERKAMNRTVSSRR